MYFKYGCEAVADSILVFLPHIQAHRAISLQEQIVVLSLDGPEVTAVNNETKLIANSPSAAKVATMEMAPEAGPDKPALLNGLCM